MLPKNIAKFSPMIVGGVIVFLLLFLGVQLVQNVFIRAANINPTDVTISEVGRNSASIIWTTSSQSQGVLEYGVTPTALNFFAPEGARTTSHNVELTLLTPNTTYYFQIKIGDKVFDNGGVPWTFNTKGEVNDEIPPTVSFPTATPESVTNNELTPTPVFSIEINSDSTSIATCDEVECDKIKDKLGKGCTTNDYLKCTRKLTPAP